MNPPEWLHLSEVVATIGSGAALALAAYVLRRWRRRAEIRNAVFTTLREELEHNYDVAEAMRKHLPAGALPYHGFELGGWKLVTQIPVFTNLDGETVTLLLKAYRRLAAANEQHALLFDLMYGPTGTLSYLIANLTPTGDPSEYNKRLEERRAELRMRLLARMEELQRHLKGALEGMGPAEAPQPSRRSVWRSRPSAAKDHGRS